MLDRMIYILLIMMIVVILTFWILYAFYPKKERVFYRELKQRQFLEDDEFYQQFYKNTNIPKDIPLQLRNLYIREMGKSFARVHPTDNIADIYYDLDFGGFLFAVEREFDVSFNDVISNIIPLDGSFDSIVRYITSKRPPHASY